MNNRIPQQLSTGWPRITPDARARAEGALSGGCYCGSGTATFKKRQIGGAVTIWLQCDGCGKGYNNSFKRADHYAWQDYPAWDETLREKYNERRTEESAVRRLAWENGNREVAGDAFARLAELQEEERVRKAEYREWCRTSPEWAEARQRILWRSRGHCEACLTNRAEFVHHLTYHHGKLPPAWCLRAVCEECHRRLHTGGDEWCEPWAARVTNAAS